MSSDTHSSSFAAQPTLGFIGQGFVGKNYADHFEDRGFTVTRYALEEPYRGNREKIRDCDIVFIAVPTPTTPQGFDVSVVREALSLVGSGKTAVIKSTILVGMTEKLSQEFPDIYLFHSPEFLREVSARADVDHPDRIIVGVPQEHFTDERWLSCARQILDISPAAPYTSVCRVREAELTKYAGNVFLYTKVVFMNMLHDVVEATGSDWESVRANVTADPRIGASHSMLAHDGGRGAGGHCFIKDFAAFKNLYEERVPQDTLGIAVWRALETKNNQLLVMSNKNLDLLAGVYGDDLDKYRSLG